MGMLPADMGKPLMTQTLMVPPPVMGRHKRCEGRTLIPFTSEYHAHHALFLARGHQPWRVRVAVRRADGCPDERHARADQLGPYDIGKLRHDLCLRMRQRGHAADSSRAPRDHTHCAV